MSFFTRYLRKRLELTSTPLYFKCSAFSCRLNIRPLTSIIWGIFLNAIRNMRGGKMDLYPLLSSIWEDEETLALLSKSLCHNYDFEPNHVFLLLLLCSKNKDRNQSFNAFYYFLYVLEWNEIIKTILKCVLKKRRKMCPILNHDIPWLGVGNGV